MLKKLVTVFVLMDCLVYGNNQATFDQCQRMNSDQIMRDGQTSVDRLNGQLNTTMQQDQQAGQQSDNAVQMQMLIQAIQQQQNNSK